MNDKSQTNRSKILQLSIFFGLAITIIGLFFTMRWQWGYDSGGYLSLARKLSHLDFSNGFSAYWSPLYPIIVAPFLFLNENSLFVGYIVQGLLGLVTLWVIRRILIKLALTEKIVNFISIVLIPLITIFVYNGVTPDLLNAVCLLLYILILIEFQSSKSVIQFVLLGAVAFLAYFAKAIAFYIVLFHLIVLFIHSIVTKRSLKEIAITLSIFLFLSIGWMGIIYAKYGIFNLSSAGPINVLLATNKGCNHTHRFMMMTAPPSAVAWDYWEDPTNYMHYNFATGSQVSVPKAKPSSLRTIISKIKINAQIFTKEFLFTGVLLPIVLILFLFRYCRHSRYRQHYALFLLLSFIVIHMGAHLIFQLSFRYIQIDVYLMVILLALLAQELSDRKTILNLLLCFAFINAAAGLGIFFIKGRRNITDYSAVVSALKEKNVQGNFVGNNRINTGQLAFLLHSRSYGLFIEPDSGVARKIPLSDRYFEDYRRNGVKDIQWIADSAQYYFDYYNYVPSNIPIDRLVYSSKKPLVNVYSVKHPSN